MIWGIRWSVIFVLLLSGSQPEKYWEPLHLTTCVFLFHRDLYVPGQKGTERWTHGKRCPPNHPSYEILCFCQGVKSLLSTDGQRIPLAWAARHPSVWRRGLRFCTYMPHFWVATEHVHLLKGHFASRGRLHCSKRRTRLGYVKYAQQGQGLIATGWRVLDPHLSAIHNILHSQVSEMPAWQHWSRTGLRVASCSCAN